MWRLGSYHDLPNHHMAWCSPVLDDQIPTFAALAAVIDLPSRFCPVHPPAVAIHRQQLIDLLTSAGDVMSREELGEVLAALTGEGSAEEALAEWVDATTFSCEVLGFEQDAVAATTQTP